MTVQPPIRTVYMQQFEREKLIPMLKANPQLDLVTARNADELRRSLPGAELLIANNRSFDERTGPVVISHGKELRWVQFSTSGIERGVRYGLPRGIPVCAASIRGPTVAEHVMLLLLASFRRFREIEMARSRRDWIRNHLYAHARTLEGATLVVVGFGGIGQEIARKAKAFDMRVITVTRKGTAGPTVDRAVTRAQLPEVLPEADAVVLCLPSGPDTVGLFGTTEFARMKPDAVFINIARGELVDENALIQAIASKQIGGAALDVATVEPLPADSPLWTFENVLISPHCAGCGSDGLDRFNAILEENLRRYRAGEPLIGVIDWESAATPASATSADRRMR
jgi:phosphoglycerate dehydrogenase-like enzyme